MLILSSGIIIDLTSDRAKYHALQLPGIAATDPHSALYPLVDIVVRNRDNEGSPCRGWTEFDFSYSGYTLGDIRLSNSWSDEEKSEILRWAQLANQKRIIELARRRLSENQNQLSIKQYSAPKHLYSVLYNRCSALPQKSASLKQWQATINNMRNKGIRDDEINWTGLPLLLTKCSPDQVLTKQELLQHLQHKNIRIKLSSEQIWGSNGGLCFEEVAQRMPHQAVYRAALKLDNSCDTILRFKDRAYNYRVGVVKTLSSGHNMALNKYWFALDPYGRAIKNIRSNDNTGAKPQDECRDKPQDEPKDNPVDVPIDKQQNNETALFFQSSADAKAAASNHAREQLGMRNGVSNHTRFDHLTLFGGEDYREWTISLPDHQRTFFGAHFYDHNVLVHVRTTTRTDENGQRLLFIEEIQSDWHQSGSRYGYDTSYWGEVANAPFKKEWAALAAKLMLIHASQNGFAGIAWPYGDVQEKRYKTGLQAIKQHYDVEVPKALNRIGKPFQNCVGKTYIQTRDPWLTLERSKDKWLVADNQGKFKTRAKYKNRDEAMAVITRHCKNIELEIPVFYFSNELKQQIAEKGLPLFGELLE